MSYDFTVTPDNYQFTVTNAVSGASTGDSPQSPETKLGSDCSGSSGATGRVLTLANSSLTLAGGFLISKGGFILNPDDYSVSHLAASSTVTFTSVKVYDNDEIVVYYFN